MSRTKRSRQCGKKKRHDSKDKALIHARYLIEKTGRAFSVYKCGYCGHWHVGNSHEGNTLLGFVPIRGRYVKRTEKPEPCPDELT